ncbi:MAG: FGGY-family carbohydrate kinase [Eubacteriales bacterium]|nr:FGGY-family carbohydrate kinase [Eubacteriales bacterium]
MNALLGIDIGTSACKSALFTAQGEVLAQADAAYAVEYPRPGWAQQEPEIWWRAACRAAREALAKAPQAQIACVGVDGQSWSAVLLDAQGEVLCPSPIWMDTRAQAVCEGLDEKRFFAVSGNPMKPSYTLPKVLWMKSHWPQAYEKAAVVLQSNGFLVQRLTGAITQDVSQGYGWQCFDMRRGTWDHEAAREVGVRKDLLPPVCECAQMVGHVTAQAAALTGIKQGTPVVAGGLDAACGSLGAGVWQAGQTQEQGGQAGGMSICLEAYAAHPALILSRHVAPGKWLLQGGTVGGGGALKWLRAQVCPELSFAQMGELADGIPAGSEGLVFLPYLAGERSPLWNPSARGVFFGLDYAKTRGHLIRAVMEGVAYSLRHNLEIAAEAGAGASVLRAMGGSANSEVWTQIKADVTGCPIEVPGSDTATTLGAAMLAGVGCGVYASFAQAASVVRVARRHEPRAIPAYEKGYSLYRRLYDQTKDLMEESI